MKDLENLMTMLAESSEGLTLQEYKQLVLGEIRREFGSQEIYVPQVNSRKDPDRADRIKEAAKKLPTGVVAQRHGVSRSYVARVIKK